MSTTSISTSKIGCKLKKGYVIKTLNKTDQISLPRMLASQRTLFLGQVFNFTSVKNLIFKFSEVISIYEPVYKENLTRLIYSVQVYKVLHGTGILMFNQIIAWS